MRAGGSGRLQEIHTGLDRFCAWGGGKRSPPLPGTGICSSLRFHALGALLNKNMIGLTKQNPQTSMRPNTCFAAYADMNVASKRYIKT